MTGRGRVDNLGQLLDQLCKAGEKESGRVAVGQLLQEFGRRSFGPLLIIPSLIAFTPLGGIPGLPTVLAVIVIAIAAQLVIGMDHFWLPKFIGNRSIKKEKLQQSVAYARPVARVIDKLLRPRLAWLTQEPFVHAAAVICILVALTVPPLEVVPFGGSASWAAIGMFGLALLAHDGLLALIAFAFSLGAGYVVFTFLF